MYHLIYSIVPTEIWIVIKIPSSCMGGHICPQRIRVIT